MASDRQPAYPVASEPAASNEVLDTLASLGFSTTDIPVSSVDTDTDTAAVQYIETGAPDTYSRGIPFCAMSVVALLIVLGLIVFS